MGIPFRAKWSASRPGARRSRFPQVVYVTVPPTVGVVLRDCQVLKQTSKMRFMPARRWWSRGSVVKEHSLPLPRNGLPNRRSPLPRGKQQCLFVALWRECCTPKWWAPAPPHIAGALRHRSAIRRSKARPRDREVFGYRTRPPVAALMPSDRCRKRLRSVESYRTSPPSWPPAHRQRLSEGLLG